MNASIPTRLGQKSFLLRMSAAVSAALLLTMRVQAADLEAGNVPMPSSVLPTASFAATPAPPKKNFHVCLLMGQSNMAGRDRNKLTEQVDNPHALTGIIKEVLWHQGEANSATQVDVETYGAHLTKMTGDLWQDLGLPGLPVMVGQPGTFLRREKQPFAETVRAAIAQVPAVVVHTDHAGSTRLEHKDDRLHFNADGAKELGARYARVIRELENDAVG